MRCWNLDELLGCIGQEFVSNFVFGALSLLDNILKEVNDWICGCSWTTFRHAMYCYKRYNYIRRRMMNTCLLFYRKIKITIEFRYVNDVCSMLGAKNPILMITSCSLRNMELVLGLGCVPPGCFLFFYCWVALWVSWKMRRAPKISELDPHATWLIVRVRRWQEISRTTLFISIFRPKM